MDSGLRRNDGEEAFAGMTAEKKGIPAFAG
jgi:hypothetical protein